VGCFDFASAAGSENGWTRDINADLMVSDNVVWFAYVCSYIELSPSKTLSLLCLNL
jgi:hypothetical protein